MSLRFVIGAAGAGKSRVLQDEIIGRSQKDSRRQFVVVVPEQFTMQTQKEIVERHPRHGIMNIDVQSFGRLCFRIADEVGAKEQSVLDDTGKNLILRRLAGSMEDRLTAIGSGICRRGSIQEIKSAISEFMQYGIGPEELGRLAEFASEKKLLSQKLKDLGQIYEAFLRYLGERFITKEEKLDILAQNIRKSRLLRGSIVAFDGFTGFTPVQNNVIRELLCCCEEVIVTLILPGEEVESYREDADEHRLFSLSMRTMRSLEQLAREAGVERGEDIILSGEPRRFSTSAPLAFLERHLFRGDDAVYTEDCGKALTAFAARDPEEEMQEIFRRIRRLTLTEAFSYREIAVITGDPERYAPYAEAAAASCGIPCFIDLNRKLEHNPFTEFLRSALECVERDFAYENVMHFLRCGMSGLPEEEIDALDNYLLATGARGYSAWKENFVRRPRYMRDGEGDMEIVNRVRARVLTLLAPLLEAGRKAKAEDFVAAQYEFIVSAGLYEQLEEYVRKFEAEGEQERVKEYSQVYEQLCRLLEQIAELLAGEELELKEYTEIFLAGIDEIKLGVLPQDVDRVVLGDVERTRLKPVRVLFFAGLNDGIIPAALKRGGMISDIDREFLEGSGFALSPTPRQQMFIQRLYLYHMLSRPSERLVLSFSRTDEKGEAIRESYIVGRLKKLFKELRFVPLDRCEAETPEAGEIAQLLSAYARGVLPEEERLWFGSCFTVFREKEEEKARRLADAAFYRYLPPQLSARAVAAAYGKELHGSVSRMESFASCAYAHYLSYGLRLMERESSELLPPDLGTIYHGVLEHFGRELKQEGLQWADADEALVEERLPRLLEEAVAEYGSLRLHQNARSAYRMKQMRRILKRSILTVGTQLKRGDFIPYAYEKTFIRKLSGELPEGAPRMLLSGKIDRVDLLTEDDRVYVKLTDYKSGRKKFDIRELYDGRQLQLPVYLSEVLAALRNSDAGKRYIPAAVFYYILRDPIIKGEDIGEDGVEAVLRRELRLTGLISGDEKIVRGLDRDDAGDVIRVSRKKDGSFTAASEVIEPEALEAVMRFAEKKLESLGRRIASGEIAAAPLDADSCKWCPHSGECPFDPRTPGCAYRGGTGSAEAAWNGIMNGEEQDGRDQLHG